METVIDRAVIEKLSVEERLRLVDLILDTLAGRDDLPMSDALYQEFMRRLEDARSAPDDGMSPTEFAHAVRSRRE